MKVIDFHPDDLLDRELSGVLSVTEQRRLLEHLEQCQICRLERQLRADFRAELARPALEQALQSSVSGALRAALPEGAPPTGEGWRVPRARRRRGLPALAAAAVVVISGVAAAQSGWGERVWTQAQSLFTDNAPPQAHEPIKDGKRAVAAPVELGERPATNEAHSAVAVAAGEPAGEAGQGVAAPSSEASAPSSEVAAPKVGAPSVKRARARARKAAAEAASARARTTKQSAQVAVEAASAEASAHGESTNSFLATAPRSTGEPRVVSSVASPSAQPVLVSNQASAAAPELAAEGVPAAVSPAPQAPVVSASTLFDQANSARRQGRIAEALSLYASLRERFITSAEARLSLALVARMRLDQGEPEAAITGFEAYLATLDAALREQALAGRALALGRLGLTSQEKAGWRDLLRAYPNSSYAELAEQRLGGAEAPERHTRGAVR